jgi:tetratricopeptide (TPR) repeat protein
LLSERERSVLNRIAVFPGSFTVEAAAFVAGDDPTDEFAVIDILGQLIAHSLVVVDAIDTGTRYRLFETTRAYAREKLAEGGEDGLMARRHAQYFRDLLEPAPDDRLRVSDERWRAAYLPELDNVRAALDWALGAGGDPTLGLSLSGTSGALWPELALLSEGRQRLEAAVVRIGSETPAHDLAQVWYSMGLQYSHNTPTQAVVEFERAASLYRRLGDDLGLVRSLHSLVMNLLFLARFDSAMAVLTEAFPVLERARLPKALARYYDDLGFLATLSGDLADARKHYEKALDIYRDAGAERDSLDTLGNLAEVTWAAGDLDAALAACRETIAMARKPPPTMRVTLGRNLLNLSGILTERGELDEALSAAREGLPFLREMGTAWWSLDHVALRAALVGNLANAACLAGFVDSVRAAKESPRQPNEARARDRLEVLLRERLPFDELHLLFAVGANMTEEEASRMALDE